MFHVGRKRMRLTLKMMTKKTMGMRIMKATEFANGGATGFFSFSGLSM